MHNGLDCSNLGLRLIVGIFDYQINTRLRFIGLISRLSHPGSVPSCCDDYAEARMYCGGHAITAAKDRS